MLQYRIKSYSAGKLIYGPHDPHSFVYNIVSGWVAISHDLLDGQRQISQFLTKGAIFGFAPEGLVSNGKSVVALDDVTVCAMPSSTLSVLLNSHPQLNRRLVWMMGRESLITENRLAFVGQTSALTRIANLLMELIVMATHKQDHEAGSHIRLPLTQSQIGDATGLTAIHVNRMLRKLREDRLLDFHDGVLSILNPEALKTLAQLGDEIANAWAIE
jgi:CRP-like cAMP-binding protein